MVLLTVPFRGESTSPLGRVIAGANIVDPKLPKTTIEAMMVERTDPPKVE
jgi:hypothetical protein